MPSESGTRIASSRALTVTITLALLCSCVSSQAVHTGTLTGGARDVELLKAGVGDYLQAKYLPDVFGRRRVLLEHSKTLFEEVLSDDAASPKSKREAADMLSKVTARLRGASN